MKLENTSITYGTNMVSKILKRNDIYYCANCHMRIFNLQEMPTYCAFCGYSFSNWETVAFDFYKEEMKNANCE